LFVGSRTAASKTTSIASTGIMALTLGAPIPEILWSSLEDVLSTSMRLFAKDIAKTLGQPEGPLLKALQAETIRPYILESESHEIDTCCGVLCVKPEAPHFLQTCGQPIVWTSTTRRCMEHLAYRPPRITSLPRVKKLEDRALYVDEDGTVYDEDNTRVGRYREGVLSLFEVNE
jgi:hypothetical protein